MDTWRYVFAYSETFLITGSHLTFRWMFDCCRVPGLEGCDWSVSHAKRGETGNSGHVVVLRRGRFWKIDIARDGELLGTADLER
jgi:carnitine O-acetyltransferase